MRDRGGVGLGLGLGLMISLPTDAAAFAGANAGVAAFAVAPAEGAPPPTTSGPTTPTATPSAPPAKPAEPVDPTTVMASEGPEEEPSRGRARRRARAQAKEAKPPKEKKPDRLEFGGLPATNYDSDLGVGFGAIATLAKFFPGYRPYRWRLEALIYATAKRAPGKGVEVPFHDDYITADVPGLFNNTLRISARVGFKKFSTTGYYGIGNGSQATKPWEAIDPDAEADAYKAARRYNQYDRTYPGFDFNARIKAWDQSIPEHRRRLEVFVGTTFAYNLIRPYPGSKLEEDIAAATQSTADGRTLSKLLQGTSDHALLRFNLGLLWDTRDHEYVPTRGTFTELSARVSPGVQDQLYHAGFNLNSSWYQSLVGRYLVLAVRGVADVIVGNAPFYELARYGAFIVRDGPGGSWSLRGVPRQRFYGKSKVIANVELRSEFLPFHIRSQRFVLGAIAFLDSGRVWADVRRTELAGRTVDGGGMAVGVGGGLRLRWGETFIVRVDPSYSLTERNFGVYIDIGHIF